MTFSGAIVLPSLAISLQPNHWFVCFYKARLQSTGGQTRARRENSAHLIN